MLKKLPTGNYTVTVFNADSSNIRHGEIDLGRRIILTKKKTLNYDCPEDSGYEYTAAISFLSTEVPFKSSVPP